MINNLNMLINNTFDVVKYLFFIYFKYIKILVRGIVEIDPSNNIFGHCSAIAFYIFLI